MPINSSPRFFINTPTIEHDNFINLLQVGWDKCDAGYTYSHFRDMYIIHYIKSGKGTIETNDNKYHLSQGDAFIVRPRILTVQTADLKEPWELYFFAFSGDYAKELVEKTVFKNNTISVATKDPTFWKTITDSAIDLNITSENKIKQYEYLFRLLSYFDFSTSPYTLNIEDSGKYQKYVSEIQQYIQSNYSKTIKISELADILNVSRSHLYRVFKDSTGSSIEEYIVAVRMNAARSLLEDTDFSAASISTLIGYSHYSTFFRMFKMYTGITPLDYRRKSREQQFSKEKEKRNNSLQ